MGVQLPELPGYLAHVAGIAVAIILSANLLRGPNLDKIPTMGSSGWLDSLWAGFYRENVRDAIQEGYKKHKSRPFKIAGRYGWLVIVSSHKHIDELCRAPEDVLSFLEGSRERINANLTLGTHDPKILARVIRSQLTRRLGELYPVIRDEVVTAFDEVLDLKDNEWKSVAAIDAVQQVVCRTIQRLFVGLPLCRNPDWINLNLHHTIDIFVTGFVLGIYPKFIRSIAAYLHTGAIRRGRARALKLVGPIIDDRLRWLNGNGNKSYDKPNDLISWLMDEVKDVQWTTKTLACNVTVANFAALHSFSNSFAVALFYLAANPQYIEPLREEVESIVKKEGWSKEALDKMCKVDSFLRECARLEGLALGPLRKALQDFTFSDGTFIPKGTLLGVASECVQHDEQFYERAKEFEPFRFAEMRRKEEHHAQWQYVSTGTEYLPFGHGRHACPGRFFAAIELKSMLAHIVVSYDVKLEGDDATRSPALRFGFETVANPHARVLFRKRADEQ